MKYKVFSTFTLVFGGFFTDPDRIGSGFLADPDPDPDSEKKADTDPGKKLGSETLLAVPYFTISVYGSSCSSLFFSLILSYFLSLSIIFCIGYADCQSQNNRKRK